MDYLFIEPIEFPSLSNTQIARFVTHLFHHAPSLLADYDDESINQGLWELVGAGDFAQLLSDDVPLSAKLDSIQAIPTLFEQLLLPRCADCLSHLDEAHCKPLNSICYMWWDIFPTWGQPDNPAVAEIDGAILNVLKQLLTLDSLAIQESALHGLGHWHLNYPQQTEHIIDDFLATHPDLRPELKHYALNARDGCVL